MAIQVALILSVLLQFGAAIIALSLVKRTINNVAWWLISLGFLLMALRRLIEIFQVYRSEVSYITDLLNSWTGVLISIVMLISLLFIKRIFNIQEQIEDLRKQNESRVLSAILKTEEKERQHFSKELHDGLGPLLSSIKLAISSMGQEQNYDDKVIQNAEVIIDESIGTLKEISNRLSPHMLKNFGLFRAVKSFIGKLSLKDGPEIHFNANFENERFSFNVEVVLYRVICELVSNTLTHAHADNIHIDLIKSGDHLILKYRDDGMGIEEDKLKDGFTGLGYSNIRSRIKSLDGVLDLSSEPGKGIMVNAQIHIN